MGRSCSSIVIGVAIDEHKSRQHIEETDSIVAECRNTPEDGNRSQERTSVMKQHHVEGGKEAQTGKPIEAFSNFGSL